MSEANKPMQPKFTLELRQDAARLVIEKGYPYSRPLPAWRVAERAAPLGQAERGGRASDNRQNATLGLADQQELARLRNENERLRMEREILKTPRPSPSARLRTGFAKEFR